MYFLADLATVDGSMNKREISLLKEMNILLELSSEDFERIITTYTQKQKKAKAPESANSWKYELQRAYQTLGVSENASMSAIKKAYRQLVMLHHPDRYATASIDQQEVAELRFLEIQKAYEVLEKREK